MYILGVRIDNFSKSEVLEKIGLFLKEERFHQVATINPEFIMVASKDAKFRGILNTSDLNIADGIGIKYAFARYGEMLKCRFAGADVLHEILYLAYKHGYGVYLAVNARGLSSFEDTRKALKLLYPGFKIEGADFDPKNDFQCPDIRDCQILLCNFGAPYQEKFINSVKNDTIRLAMGVGGSFDFITKKIIRAPKIMRYAGLEWLWRLMLQPKRISRIINAVLLFPIKIIFTKMPNNDVEVKIVQSDADLAKAMEIRKKVFQEEQGIEETLDFDGKDQHSDQFLAYFNGSAIGTGRLRFSYANEKRIAKVERMAVIKEQRGKGVGKKIVSVMHDYLKSKQVYDINLDTPLQAKGFYEKMGYLQNGEPFTEVGMPYIRMSIKL